MHNHPLKSPKDARRLIKMQSATKRKELMNHIDRANVDKLHILLKKGVDPNFSSSLHNGEVNLCDFCIFASVCDFSP